MVKTWVRADIDAKELIQELKAISKMFHALFNSLKKTVKSKLRTVNGNEKAKHENASQKVREHHMVQGSAFIHSHENPELFSVSDKSGGFVKNEFPV